MNRFEKAPCRMSRIRPLLPLFIFLVVLLLFLGGLTGISDTTSQKEAESLENSVRRSVIQCYALEGFYPEDLSYLEEHYGLTYNREKYVISYEVIGSNMMPDIMVIPLNAEERRTP